MCTDRKCNHCCIHYDTCLNSYRTAIQNTAATLEVSVGAVTFDSTTSGIISGPGKSDLILCDNVVSKNIQHAVVVPYAVHIPRSHITQQRPWVILSVDVRKFLILLRGTRTTKRWCYHLPRRNVISTIVSINAMERKSLAGCLYICDAAFDVARSAAEASSTALQLSS